ncbi:MAG: capsid cement protein [Hyphomicrobiales bacterium]
MPTPDLVEVLVPAAARIVEVVIPGPQGPTGDTTITLPAGAAVSGHRVIAWENGEARHADPTVLTDGRRVIGVSLNAALTGDPVTVRQSGLVVDASLALVPGLPVFLGPDGALIQTPPTAPSAAFQLRIGSALSPDTLLVRISQPISL